MNALQNAKRKLKIKGNTEHINCDYRQTCYDIHNKFKEVDLIMAFELPKLPYEYDALEPVIDKQTMEIHHTKHHQTYVTNLNKVIEGTEYESLELEELVKKIDTLPESIQTAVRNNGGGHLNHSLFWNLLQSPNEETTIPSELSDKLIEDFGSIESFKEKFEASAKGRFGSGWAWLVDNQGTLEVIDLPNQDNPLMIGKTPLFGLDVWEHAYYLNYQNRRPEYVSNFWKVVNWEQVNKLWKEI